jgi:deoxyadenosine/deoxycytidine kinase
LQSIALEQFNYVALEGNIEQKTTLATKIAEDFNAKTSALQTTFYQKFYKDQNRYAFRLRCLFFWPIGISSCQMI